MNEFSSASGPEEENTSSENDLSDDDGFLVVAVVAVAARKFYVADSGYVNKDCFLSHFDERHIIYSNIENVESDWALGGKHLTTSIHRCGIVLSKLLVMVQVGDPILEEYAADSVPVGGHVDVNADYVLTDRGLI
ncbi:hypothetical protein TIFTF001_042258 [Ficus carica]|uniref:Uncharacterized protein n=1 Tax=Ficus carica TaxID=3494 RepID=A0AA87ZLP2_FICCA|nr:hypothetical protein TIFTF001_042258 [Ficus carica]